MCDYGAAVVDFFHDLVMLNGAALMFKEIIVVILCTYEALDSLLKCLKNLRDCPRDCFSV